MIAGNIKLTQADGNVMLVEPHTVEVIETVSLEDMPTAKIGVWMMLEQGVVSSALLKDGFGWLLQKLSQTRPRLQLTTPSGGKLSVPVDIIKRVIETSNMTILHTSLQTGAGAALRLGVTEKVEEIMDLAGMNADEEEEQIAPAPAPKPKPRRRKAAATSA